jgi:hypothetical protein
MAGTIHSTDYHINGASGDIAHFSTNDKVVHIFDDDKKDLGTLRDLYVRGKALSGVDFKTIKVTGLYTITGIKNVPGSVDTSKPVLLQVTAIGSPNSPDMVFYRLIDNKGNITECTVAGTKQSAWASGGVELKQTISDINDSLGALNKLNTDNKNSLTDSINEVNSKAIANTSSINDLTSKFNSHNHDDRYLRSDGKNKMSNNLILPNYKSLYMENSKGINLNTAYASKNDELIIGDNGYNNIKMQTKGKLYVNGHQVYTDANAGQGSGIDADKLDGVEGDRYARRDQNNIFNGDVIISNEITMNADQSVKWVNSNGKQIGGIRTRASDKAILFEHSGKDDWQTYITPGGNFGTTNGLIMDGPVENQIRFKRNGDNGVGIIRRTDEQFMVFYDWLRNNQILKVGDNEGHNSVTFYEAPYFNKSRRFYLQDEQPNSAPYGSVWIGF